MGEKNVRNIARVFFFFFFPSLIDPQFIQRETNGQKLICQITPMDSPIFDAG